MARSIVKQSLPKQEYSSGTREPIGLLVAAVRRRLKQSVTALVREHRLSPQQFWTLVAVAREPGLSLGNLAGRRRMDQPTACRVVDTLVRRRLVKKAPDPGDQRRLRLVLTPAGAALSLSLLPLASTIGRAVEAGLSRAEKEAITSGLGKVLRNLDRFAATASATDIASSPAGKRRKSHEA